RMDGKSLATRYRCRGTRCHHLLCTRSTRQNIRSVRQTIRRTCKESFEGHWSISPSSSQQHGQGKCRSTKFRHGRFPCPSRHNLQVLIIGPPFRKHHSHFQHNRLRSPRTRPAIHHQRKQDLLRRPTRRTRWTRIPKAFILSSQCQGTQFPLLPRDRVGRRQYHGRTNRRQETCCNNK